jgi:hypothetical protein
MPWRSEAMKWRRLSVTMTRAPSARDLGDVDVVDATAGDAVLHGGFQQAAPIAGREVADRDSIEDFAVEQLQRLGGRQSELGRHPRATE